MKRKHARRFTIKTSLFKKTYIYIYYASGKLTKSPSKNPPCVFRSFHTIQAWHLSQKFCQCWPIRSCWSPFFTRRARALSKDTPRVEHDLVGPHNEALRNKDMEQNMMLEWLLMLNQITTGNGYENKKYMIYIYTHVCIQMLYIKQTEFPESHRVL